MDWGKKKEKSIKETKKQWLEKYKREMCGSQSNQTEKMV